ncbi:MAG: histidinol-phosphatase [Bacteroidales bacterium]|nr:histidinol-phosphatase [Bacteroidales bacterium]
MKDDIALQNLCLHTHNIFCDGKEDINSLINNAVSQGITQIGISSHAPLKIKNKWSMELEQIDNYVIEIAQAKIKYHNKIEIFTALEIDYIKDKTYSFDFFRNKMSLDYTIGSIHLVSHPISKELWFIDGDKNNSVDNMNRIFDNNVRYAIENYFAQTREMIRSQKPDIIGHMDKVIMNIGHLFDPNSLWYRDEITKTLLEIKKHKVIVEANTRGLYKGKWNDTFPSKTILRQCLNMEIPITLSSDAHHSSELLLSYDKVRQELKEMGFMYLKGRINNKWGNFPI